MPSSPATKVLLGVAGLVLVAGATLAVTQPGDLGDDPADDTETADGATTTTASTTTTATATAGADPTAAESTVTVATPTTVASAGVTQTTDAGASTTTPTTAATVTTAPTTATTAGPGSGLGEPDISRADASTAATGIESMLGPGLGLVGAAGVLRVAARRRLAS